MSGFGALKEKTQGFLKGDKKVKVILLFGIIGILLILASEFFGKGEAKQETFQQEQAVTAQEYAESLEKKLSAMLSSMEGVGTARIMITMNNGTEYVYEKDESTQTDTKSESGGGNSEKKSRDQSIVLVGDGKGNENALIQKELAPKIKGVLVVCQGGGDVAIQERIVNAVTTALDISSAKVCVAKMAPAAK